TKPPPPSSRPSSPVRWHLLVAPSGGGRLGRLRPRPVAARVAVVPGRSGAQGCGAPGPRTAAHLLLAVRGRCGEHAVRSGACARRRGLRNGFGGHGGGPCDRSAALVDQSGGGTGCARGGGPGRTPGPRACVRVGCRNGEAGLGRDATPRACGVLVAHGNRRSRLRGYG